MKNNARRKLLMLTGGTAITLSAPPNKWVKPIIDEALLPAHAQTSGECEITCENGVSIELTWAVPPTQTSSDLDLILETPSGERLSGKIENGVSESKCGLVHLGDSDGKNGEDEVLGNGGSGIEKITGGTDLAKGVYRIIPNFGEIDGYLRVRVCDVEADDILDLSLAEFEIYDNRPPRITIERN